MRKQEHDEWFTYASFLVSSARAGVEESVIEAVIERIIEEGWSARKIEQFVAARKHAVVEGDDTVRPMPFAQYESKFSTKFAAPVRISANAKGAGTLTISFKGKDDLERIQSLLK